MNVVKALPPLVIEEAEIRRFAAALEDGAWPPPNGCPRRSRASGHGWRTKISPAPGRWSATVSLPHAASLPGSPCPCSREDIRNVAIVAHVDHGKTTLVDAMLWQSGAFRVGQDVADRVLDSMDLEREKGITILAKNTSLHYQGVKLNIVDTPGHADFGGEVERGLDDGRWGAAAGGRLRGPAAADALRAAQGAGGAPAGDPRRQQDRPPRRARGGGDRRGLRAVPRPRRRRGADRVPDRLLQRQRRHRDARVRRREERRRRRSRAPTLAPLLDLLVEHIPAPTYEPEHPLQALVTNLDASPYVGRLAICRVRNGRSAAASRSRGAAPTARSSARRCRSCT